MTKMEFVHNPEGYIRYYGPNEHYHFYYIKDLLGNIRETYVQPEAGYKECIQCMQYYPSGLPWAEAAGAYPIGSAVIAIMIWIILWIFIEVAAGDL